MDRDEFNSDRIAEQIQTIKKESSRGVLAQLVNIQDSLTFAMAESQEKTVAQIASDALASFFDSNPNFVSATTRKPSDLDKTKLLPGQHIGVHIVFGLADGSILRINIYGGLRALANADMRDSDRTLQHSHTNRTDAISSQPTFLNWYIKRPDETTICNVWIKKTPNGVSLNKMIYDDQKIDIAATINKGAYGFTKISDDLTKSINDLTKIIPGSYY